MELQMTRCVNSGYRISLCGATGEAVGAPHSNWRFPI